VLDSRTENALADGLSKGSRLIPKRLITIFTRDGEVDKVVETIIKASREGNKGDGKIFIMPVLDAVRSEPANGEKIRFRSN